MVIVGHDRNPVQISGNAWNIITSIHTFYARGHNPQVKDQFLTSFNFVLEKLIREKFESQKLDELSNIKY